MSSQSQETAEDTQSSADRYSVRWFRSGDADGVRSLFEDALGRTRSRAYVDWKYVDDPTSPRPDQRRRTRRRPGRRAGVPPPVGSGAPDRTVLALQPAGCGHPRTDHRRNGLYTRMTRQAIDRYEDGELSLFFNYRPRRAGRPTEARRWNRSANSTSTTGSSDPLRFGDALDDALGSAGGGRTLWARRVDGLCTRDVRGPRQGQGRRRSAFQVERHDEPPAAHLASLYERSIPERLHVDREERFYEWWPADPTHDYRTHCRPVASGDPVAGLVTRADRQRVCCEPATRCRSPNQTCGPARTAAVGGARRPPRDADVVKSVGETLPADLLGRSGLSVRDSAPVLDGRTKPLRMGRPTAIE